LAASRKDSISPTPRVTTLSPATAKVARGAAGPVIAVNQGTPY
jgi:hypothetical protein